MSSPTVGTPEYEALHAACPKCGSLDVYSTTMASLGDKDGNKAACLCGWKGIVHDMVPKAVAEPCPRCNGTKEITKTLRYTGEPLILTCPDCRPKE